jgi:phage tail-like protein
MSITTNSMVAGNFFKLDCQGKLMGIFQKAQGGNFEVSKIEYKYVDGGGKPVHNFSHGAPKYNDLVLERALMQEGRKEMQEWLKQVHDGNVEEARKHVTLTLCDVNGNALVAISYHDAYPVKAEFSGIDANGTSFVTEKVTLAYRYMQYEQA